MANAFNGTFDALPNWVKTGLAIAGLLGIGATAQAQVSKYVDSKVEDRILCIMVADHRKLDWQLCFIDPNAVMPSPDGLITR